MQRFMVRRKTGEVFIWTELISVVKDLEEVWAEDAKQALDRKSMPNPKSVSIDEIEAMTTADLLLFASTKLGLSLDKKVGKAELQDAVKEALFTQAIDAPETSTPRTATAPMATAREAVMRKGV